ncbi:uncharacterized protein LOC135945409 [Cloeon dipterum]|uniref:uncharacterized protein LOC135945409 n=1 Tax=Cloeon dipterum TaxID=197152 RepID=UPI00321FAD91
MLIKFETHPEGVCLQRRGRHARVHVWHNACVPRFPFPPTLWRNGEGRAGAGRLVGGSGGGGGAGGRADAAATKRAADLEDLTLAQSTAETPTFQLDITQEMRSAVLVQVVVLVAVAVVVCEGQQRPLGDNGPLGSALLQRHAKVARTIRGFKNMALSTARGFGKRAPPNADYAPAPQQQQQQELPVEWLAAQLSANPEVARAILRRFVDADHNERLSAEELMQQQ